MEEGDIDTLQIRLWETRGMWLGIVFEGLGVATPSFTSSRQHLCLVNLGSHFQDETPIDFLHPFIRKV